MASVVCDRLALLVINELVPSYMFSCRLAMLSKVKSMVIEKVGDIRPIGILSNLWKVIERAIKILTDESSADIFAVGTE